MWKEHPLEVLRSPEINRNPNPKKPILILTSTIKVTSTLNHPQHEVDPTPSTLSYTLNPKPEICRTTSVPIPLATGSNRSSCEASGIAGLGLGRKVRVTVRLKIEVWLALGLGLRLGLRVKG